jgi:hypothetical protein
MKDDNSKTLAWSTETVCEEGAIETIFKGTVTLECLEEMIYDLVGYAVANANEIDDSMGYDELKQLGANYVADLFERYYTKYNPIIG